MAQRSRSRWRSRTTLLALLSTLQFLSVDATTTLANSGEGLVIHKTQDEIKDVPSFVNYNENIDVKNSELFDAFISSKTVNDKKVVNIRRRKTNTKSAFDNVDSVKINQKREGKKFTWGDYISKSSEVPYTTSREISWDSGTETPYHSTFHNPGFHNSPHISNYNTDNPYSSNTNSNNEFRTIPNYEISSQYNVQSIGSNNNNVPVAQFQVNDENNSATASNHVLNDLTHYLIYGNDKNSENVQLPLLNAKEGISPNANFPESPVQQTFIMNNRAIYQPDQSAAGSIVNQQAIPIYSDQLVTPSNNNQDNSFSSRYTSIDQPSYKITGDNYSEDNINMKKVLKDLSDLLEILPDADEDYQEYGAINGNSNFGTAINSNPISASSSIYDRSTIGLNSLPVISTHHSIIHNPLPMDSQQFSSLDSGAAYFGDVQQAFEISTMKPTTSSIPFKLNPPGPVYTKKIRSTNFNQPIENYSPINHANGLIPSNFPTTTEKNAGSILFTSNPIFTSNTPAADDYLNNNQWQDNTYPWTTKSQQVVNQNLVMKSTTTDDIFSVSPKPLRAKNNSDDYEESFFKNNDYEYVDTEDPSWNSTVETRTSSNENGTQKAQRRTLDLLYHMFVDPTKDENGNRRNTLFEDVIKAIDDHIIGDIKALKEHRHSGQKSQSHFRENNSDFFKTLIESIGLDRNFMKSTADAFSSLNTPFEASENSPSMVHYIPSSESLQPSLYQQTQTPRLHTHNHQFRTSESSAYIPTGRGKPKVESLPSGDEYVITESDGNQQVVSINDIINSLAALDEKEITNILMGSDAINRRSDDGIENQSGSEFQSEFNDDGTPNFKIQNLIILGENGKSESLPFENIMPSKTKTRQSFQIHKNNENTEHYRPSPIVEAANHLLGGNNNYRDSVVSSVKPSPTIQAAHVLLGLNPTAVPQYNYEQNVRNNNGETVLQSSQQNEKVRVSFTPVGNTRNIIKSNSHIFSNPAQNDKSQNVEFPQAPSTLQDYREQLYQQAQEHLRKEEEKLKEEEQQLLNIQQKLQWQHADNAQSTINGNGNINKQEEYDNVKQIGKQYDEINQREQTFQRVYEQILNYQKDREQKEQQEKLMPQNRYNRPLNEGAEYTANNSPPSQDSQHNNNRYSNDIQSQLSRLNQSPRNIELPKRSLFDDNRKVPTVNQITRTQQGEIYRFRDNTNNNKRVESLQVRIPSQKAVNIRHRGDGYNSDQSNINQPLGNQGQLHDVRNTHLSYERPRHKKESYNRQFEPSTTPSSIRFHTPPDVSYSREHSYHSSKHDHRSSSEINPYDLEIFRKHIQKNEMNENKRQNFASSMYDQVMKSLPKPIHFKKITTPAPPERPQIFGFDIPNIFPSVHNHNSNQETIVEDEDSTKEDLKWDDPLGLLSIYDLIPFSRKNTQSKSYPTTQKPTSAADRFREALRQGNVPPNVSKILVNQMKEKSRTSSNSKIPHSLQHLSKSTTSNSRYSSRREPTRYGGKQIAHRRSNYYESKRRSSHYPSSEYSSHQFTNSYSQPHSSYTNNNQFGPPRPSSVVPQEGYGEPQYYSHQVDDTREHYYNGGSSNEYDSYIVPLGHQPPPPKDQPFFDIALLFNSVKVDKSGDDNESISLPKIGDPSKFVNVHRPPHYK